MEKDSRKILAVNLLDDKHAEKVAKALSNKCRRDIIRALQSGPKSIYTLSLILNIPMSTLSEHISILLKSGICSVARVLTDRGQSKVITRQYEDITFDISGATLPKTDIKNFKVEIPIGSYNSFNVHQYGGMISEDSQIGVRDDPNNFYHPERIRAQIIWFDYGYLEYFVPFNASEYGKILSISFSQEICSESPGYCEDWKSDIFFEINGVEIGIYTSPGDFGARRGIITPLWRDGTQYGILKTIQVKEDGTYLDGVKVSNVCIGDLKIEENPIVKYRIGVKENAKNRGGINIFGNKCGDHPQHIIMTISHL